MIDIGKEERTTHNRGNDSEGAKVLRLTLIEREMG